MTHSLSNSEMNRRNFALMLAGAAGFSVSGTKLFADGGQDLTPRFPIELYDDDLVDEDDAIHIYTQLQYLGFSSRRMGNYARMPGAAVVNGFSLAMSIHLFKMGQAQLRLARELFRAVQAENRRRNRRNILKQAVDEAAQSLSDFSGSPNNRWKRENFYLGVRYWHQRPREGMLNIRY